MSTSLSVVVTEILDFPVVPD